jgi:hypothetical protein
MPDPAAGPLTPQPATARAAAAARMTGPRRAEYLMPSSAR